MSEETNPKAPEVTPPAPAPTPEPAKPAAPPAPPAPSPEDKARDKELEELRAFKDKAERDKLSNEDKLKKDADDAKAEALAARKEAVALKYGLPDALAARLQGSNRAELEADAKQLAELLPKQPAALANTGTPAGNPPPQPKEADRIAELEKELEKASGVQYLKLQREIAKLKSQGK